MEWHSHFQSAFFKSWRCAGLPDHEDFLSAYYLMLEQRNKKIEWIENSSGIDHSRLYDVYGFGVTVGKFFAEMFDLSTGQTTITSDWCGRFNLGISLFDYISDELAGATSVASLNVFQSFIKTKDSKPRSLSAAEELLTQLAGSVLGDLKNAGTTKNGIQKSNPLFPVLQKMFDAQNFISAERLSAGVDLKKIKKALYLKSAEPFGVMAEYTAQMADATDPCLIRKAHSIGKALGCCYWLIDDAKDVWIDLEAGQWNLFLQLAAADHPNLFAQNREGLTEKSLFQQWEQGNHAQKISEQIINRLIRSVKKLQLTDEAEQHTLGLVSASLWQWYHS